MSHFIVNFWDLSEIELAQKKTSPFKSAKGANLKPAAALCVIHFVYRGVVKF